MTTTKIEIAGVTYNVKGELDFTNIVCDFEEKGVDVISMLNGTGTQYFSLARAVIAFFTGSTTMEAGKLLTKHLKMGGDLQPILAVFRQVMESAGFGEAETTNQETPQTTEE